MKDLLLKPIQKLIISLIVFCLTFFFFAPMNLYFQNINEFGYQFVTVFRTFLMISSMSFVICLFLITLCIFLIRMINKKINLHKLVSNIASLVISAAFLLWVQGNIFAIHIGALDGRPIMWSKFQMQIFLDTIIWIVLIFWLFRFRKKLSSLINQIAILLLIMQIVNVSYGYLHLPSLPSFKTHTTNFDLVNQFSKEQNVVVIMLDSFQSDVMAELINREPDLKGNLSGFTYYPDVSGSFPTTYASVPLILTGKMYNNQIPIQDFIQNAYLADSLPKLLKAKGYKVFLPCDATIYCDNEVADSFVANTVDKWVKLDDYRTFYRPSIIRYTPTILFQLYSNNKKELDLMLNRSWPLGDPTQNWYKSDQDLLKKVTINTLTDANRPTFKFFHFFAPHPLFNMNAKMEYEMQPINREGQLNHSRGALQIALNIIQKMKKLEIYDNSTIIILADHGYGSLGYKVNGLVEEEVINNEMVGAANPLLLIKPFKAKGEIKIDDESYSYSTITQDLMRYLDNYKNDTKTIFSMTEVKTRNFYYYSWTDNWSDRYLPKMSQYQIIGDVRNPESWVKTGNDTIQK